jgi:hypothetical protein
MATLESDSRDRGQRASSRHAAEPMSIGRASFVGACTGLGIAALFVAGVRIAYRAASPPAVANAQATPEISPGVRPPDPLGAARARSVVSPDSSTASSNLQAAAAPTATPTVADASASSAFATSHTAPGGPPAWRRALPPAAPGRHVPYAKAPSSGGPLGGAGGAPEDDNSQTSLVPVIPDTPPPAVDPLVKAVQELEPSAPPKSP